jgi:hypothetical protein
LKLKLQVPALLGQESLLVLYLVLQELASLELKLQVPVLLKQESLALASADVTSWEPGVTRGVIGAEVTGAGVTEAGVTSTS